MAEIRQIQVDGVNYDLVISEDEVSATAAAQSAAQALAYKNQAQSSAAQAGQQATNASNQADRAEDAALRAEAIVGGEFVSYGQAQGLDDAQKAQARSNIDAASDSDVVKITAQTLTTAQQEQARANIMAGGSNRNLLDNPFFQVNQRELTTMSSASYAMDRWKCDNAVTNGMVYSDGVVTLASNTVFAQRIEPTLMEFLKGKTVTASLLKADGTVVSATNVVNSSGSTAFPYVGGIDLSPIRFRVVGGVAIKAVKLELGSVSTLANDAPPDYETELDHCRKYFYRIKAETSFGTFGNGFCSGDNAAYVLVPINMRKTPTSGSTSGAFRLMVGAGVTTGVTVTYSGNSNSHMARFDVSQSGSSWTAGGSCILSAHSDTNAYIDLNADL